MSFVNTSTDLERVVAMLALDHKLIDTRSALEMMTAARAEGGPSLVSSLVERFGEDILIPIIARELDYLFTDFSDPNCPWKPDIKTIERLGVEQLTLLSVLPLLHVDGHHGLAMSNPRANEDMITMISTGLGAQPAILLASPREIETRLVFFTDFAASSASAEVAPTLVARNATPPTTTSDSPVVEFVNSMLARAAAAKASDVHLKYEADGSLLLRFRIDGTLRRQQVTLRGREREIVGALLSKCSTIDASDGTRPQDGTFSFTAAGGRSIDARLGMLPQAHGRTVVCRLLDPDNINRRLDDMGFDPVILSKMREVVRAPQGAVFVIGPTGSGKTTTLYGLLRELDAMRLNILTVEDPIEYRIPFIGQTQIRGDLGEKSLTFGKALRAIMRLDPDVILVGEVRDEETAQVAMHAALTGHLVLSTIHAKSALGVYSRLERLGVEPFISAESVSMALNQRLIRRVHTCGSSDAPTTQEARYLERQGLAVPTLVSHVRDKGCSGCDGTGYRGRLAALEVLTPNEAMREALASGQSQRELLIAARGDGYMSLNEDVHRHIVDGRTTVAELARCTDSGSF